MDITSETIIDKVKSSYTKISKLYRNISVTDLTAPALPNGWSVKDTLAQMAVWHWRCAALLGEAHDTDGPLKARPDVDGLTREIYQERQDWSWAKVEADFRRAHQALLEAIRQLPPGRLRDSIVQQAIAKDTWEHYAEHLPDLERWHQQISGERVMVT